MPLINDSSPAGIAISVVIVTIAAHNLVLDFDFIESGADQRAPKYVWLYLEILSAPGEDAQQVAGPPFTHAATPDGGRTAPHSCLPVSTRVVVTTYAVVRTTRIAECSHACGVVPARRTERSGGAPRAQALAAEATGTDRRSA